MGNEARGDGTLGIWGVGSDMARWTLAGEEDGGGVRDRDSGRLQGFVDAPNPFNSLLRVSGGHGHGCTQHAGQSMAPARPLLTPVYCHA